MLCIVLCLLTALFSFITMAIVTARVGLTANHVRAAYREGDLRDMTVLTESGSVSLAELIMSSAVSVRTGEPIGLSRERAEAFLKKTTVNQFAENILADYAGCFVFGEEPAYLNADKIGNFLSLVSFDARQEIGCYIPDQEITAFKQRINGGDLSYLSIDRSGGAFKQHYGVDPGTVSAVFSVWVLIASAAMTLACILLVFILCSKNLPAGLGYNGVTLTAFGAGNLFLTVAGMIIASVSHVFFLSALLRTLMMVMGSCSIAVLIAGILMLLLRSRLRKNGVTEPPAGSPEETGQGS